MNTVFKPLGRTSTRLHPVVDRRTRLALVSFNLEDGQFCATSIFIRYAGEGTIALPRWMRGSPHAS
jgi:hypothetical protein